MSSSFDLDRYLTPYKLGMPVLTGSGEPGKFDSHAVDCPFVFYHNDMFYMLFVGFDSKGYQTGLAVSDDLIHWDKRAVVLPREDHVGWDSVGAAGNWIVKENELFGLPSLKKIDRKYWMIYHSYPEVGYEEGPAQLGLAWTEDEELVNWHRLKEPVLSWNAGADWENGGLYKPCLLEHDGTYYLYYNAKNRPAEGLTHEQTGLATSKDLKNWERHAENPVVRVTDEAWDSRFCSDPCVFSDGDIWVMYYYGFNNVKAQDGIAFSRDMYTWQKHPDPIIRTGSPGELDSKYAHKPTVVYHNDNLYHFYCACRDYREGDPAKNLHDEFRCISVATSKPL